MTPGRGGETHLGLPVFDTVPDAVAATGATVSVIYVPAPFAADAILDAADAGIELIVCITEGIPVHDMVKVKAVLREHDLPADRAELPGHHHAGRVQDRHHAGLHPQAGRVGIVSRSGTLTYEAVYQTSRNDLGQSTCVGIGGDPVRGMNFIDCLELFEQRRRRPKASSWSARSAAATRRRPREYIRDHVTKPVVAYIAGVTAPPGKRMGHAGAIISGGKGTALDKFAALEQAGVHTVRSPAELGSGMQELLRR